MCNYFVNVILRKYNFCNYLYYNFNTSLTYIRKSNYSCILSTDTDHIQCHV